MAVPDPTAAERRLESDGVQADEPPFSSSLEVDGTGGLFGRIHPIGWVALGIAVLDLVLRVVSDSDYLIGNLTLRYWVFLAIVFAASTSFALLVRIRRGIESISTFMLKGLNVSMRTGLLAALTSAIVAFVVVTALYDSEDGITAAFGTGTAVAALLMGPIWVLAWAVFILALFSSLSRYIAKFVEADLIIAEVSSLGWQSFAFIALLGVGYGVREGVNPRIDFWWANFSRRTKAWLDFVLHILLFMPFLFMVLRILYPFARNTLGYKPDRSGAGGGEWPSGWRVWETWEQQGDAGQLPVGPVQAMLFVAFILFALQIFAEVIKHGFTLIDREDLAGTDEPDAPLRIE